ncbi:beta-galactosidase [Metarhizium acridum CQMa 102]|uniref:Beta-galactosidase n=1 Tax=Metarhizium acridum (strain CQMa 102) TaxID=655827 RepID=E9EER2_METAQ|nr:beta-galactosidase [Metarhizium acridum CQMa 102]EFY85580.1 beta-galactosidase [Metarhizium acridum CQMa 102]
MRPSTALGAVALSFCHALNLGGRPYQIIHEVDRRSGALQDFVTWDEHSLFIHGERAMMFSGEVHPFRLPVPSLYLDVFEKIKALGFNMVSFYVDWALLEGKQGEFRANGIFALEPFLEAASKAGVYLLARPGPYINAEVSGGGFPGYLQQLKGILRSQAPDFLNATDNYMAHVCDIIAKYQITNGGPVVLFQPENEYSSGHNIPFPNGQYMQYVINQARSAGISVPMINNDVGPSGNYAPGKGVGSMDIYGHDSYPLGFDCANPAVWPPNGLPTNFHQLHERQSPTSPYSIIEIYGGTNWGNLGHPGGYTSYDYGACIRENRVIDREKYSEVKLEAQFIKVSPGYITASVGLASTTAYANNPGITITPLTSNKTGNFFVARQTDYTATGSVSYTVTLPTSNGTLTIPQRGGSLSLHGRDSKIHLTDYPVGDYTLLYTTAEVFTWKKYANKTVLVLYGGPDELHEFAVKSPSPATQVLHVEGSSISSHGQDLSTIVVQWTTSPKRQYIQVGNLAIYLVDRNSAYNYWVPVLPGPKSSPYGTSLMNPDAAIINGGYLIRSASISGNTLSLRADFNASTALEVVGVPDGVTKLSVNGRPLKHTTSPTGTWLAQPDITIPTLRLPSLANLTWHTVDSLPEIHPQYDDSRWRTASQSPGNSRPQAHHRASNATLLAAPTRASLYGSDYGFNTGTLVFRGHFTASGNESLFRAWTSGGTAYASSAWLNDRFLGSFKGDDATENHNSTYALPGLTAGERYVVTVVVDTMGFNENFNPGYEDMKAPRGILDYALSSPDGAPTDVTWKITGNLGGQDYADEFRGPLNEGGLFFERQGYHYPFPPVDALFTPGSPFDGVDRAGVAYYAARMPLALPADGYDIPLSFVFADGTQRRGDYRALLYVNGFQFGKYLSNIGPQTEFPVPEGVLDYNGDNWVGLAVWSLDGTGARVPGFTLRSGTPVQSSRNKVHLVTGPSYSKRPGAY